MIPKLKWRSLLLKKRKAISSERRKQAALLLVEKLPLNRRTLSFISMGSEIDTAPLNIALKNCLFLVPYKIAPLPEVDCILVPALGFDREHYRIGYGKGYYDQLLAQYPHILSIGVGFQEQLCDLLPHDPWDIPVQELLLL